MPAEVRKRLGVGPGSILEWDEKNGEVVVRRAGKYSSADIHAELFGGFPGPVSEADIRQGVRAYIHRKHARR